MGINKLKKNIIFRDMKRFVLSVFAILTVAVTAAFAEDDRIEKAYHLRGFTSLRFETSSEVEIVKSDEYSLTISVGEEYIPYVSVELDSKSGLLTIDYEKLPFKLKNSKNRLLHVRISMPYLDALQLSGASSVKVDSVFTTSTAMAGFILDVSGASKVETLKVNASKAEIDISGSSKVNLGGEFGEIKAEVSGASKFVVKGSADLLDAEISGASKFDSEALTAAEVSISTSGASSSKIYVGKKLTVSASGASKCTYIAPRDISIDVKGISGASSFKHKSISE